MAESAARAVGSGACAAIATRSRAIAGSGPLLLRSYDAAHGDGPPAEPSQATAAYTYDNALAVIALLACGDRVQALRIAEALRLATVADARLRNTYRAGPVAEHPEPNGWWDSSAQHWAQDAYQQGSASGNIAWAALALMAAHQASGEPRWLSAAHRLGQWLIDNASDRHDGISGGVDGDDLHARRIMWKSAEHNIDAAALFDQLALAEPARGWELRAASARRLLQSLWDAESGHFYIGTLPDGTTRNRDSSALDVQLWAQLLPNSGHDRLRALRYAERVHGLPGGFDFNADRDGVWLEGTAQAALVYRVLDRERDAAPLLATIVANRSSGGYVYATREARITTGLAIGAASTSADFYYYRLPHLAATAWSVFAALRHNPFAAWPLRAKS